jgi:anti-sigma B factor antagonist
MPWRPQPLVLDSEAHVPETTAGRVLPFPTINRQGRRRAFSEPDKASPTSAYRLPLSEERPRFRVQVEGSEIYLRGELDIANVPFATAMINEAIGLGHFKLILDLSNLTFIDASGLGMFVKTQSLLGSLGGFLVLRGPSPRLRNLIHICGLSHTLQVAEHNPGESPIA